MRTTDGTTPKWQQIAADLRTRVRAGEWGRADVLPSISDLVKEWGVNRKTAVKALHQLAAEGLIEVETGIGYHVIKR